MTNSTESRGIRFLGLIEKIIPQWFWQYIYPWMIYALAVVEVITGVPSLIRAIVATNMEAMPVETHIFNVLIGVIVIPLGVRERKLDMFALGFVMIIIYVPTVIITFARGGVFLWQ